jgi:hypothetical protein
MGSGLYDCIKMILRANLLGKKFRKGHYSLNYLKMIGLMIDVFNTLLIFVHCFGLFWGLQIIIN